jgi:hypothetical protein
MEHMYCAFHETKFKLSMERLTARCLRFSGIKSNDINEGSVLVEVGLAFLSELCIKHAEPMLIRKCRCKSGACLQDEEAHRQNSRRQLEELTTKLKRTEEALRSTTTDYILARRDKQEADARAVTAETALQHEKCKAAKEVCNAYSASVTSFSKFGQ